METATIPSPTTFLNPPVLAAQPAQRTKSKIKGKKAQCSAPKAKAATANGDGTTRPKQSKSRNGCVTCKAKRLKCDETKPTCQQCHKRQVECGGYKKAFKWRTFEEATFLPKPTSPTSKKDTFPARPSKSGSPAPTQASRSRPVNDQANDIPRPSQYPFPQFQSTDTQFLSPTSCNSSDNFSFDPTLCFGAGLNQSVFLEGIPQLDTPTTSKSIFDDSSTQQSGLSTAQSFSPSQSPRLIDLLVSGSSLDAPPPPEYVEFQREPELQCQLRTHDDGQIPTPSRSFGSEEDIVEIRQHTARTWPMRLPSPSPSDSSGSSENSNLNALCAQPRILPGSPEMLISRFDQHTCGILSVKNGPSENPWRTMIWPLARDSPALYHAISSMTAFHTSKEKPALRVMGIDHMRQSIELLAGGLQNMRTDAALATTLVLAFSESWDQHISTGIKHLKGAKVLVNRALMRHQQKALNPEDLDRLKFLCNIWVYMDVIARLTSGLTSVDDDDSNDFDATLTPCGPMSLCHEVDPLMGCASTLFPLIGRVANLARKVMRCASNTVNIVSQANDLRIAIEKWQPPCIFEAPEDPSSEIEHSLRTAEAYRWATLLYLHQAVPEVPSQPAQMLAKNVVMNLALVPLSSRAIIVHIYPLLAAGCEVVDEERQWVEERWAAMVSRMSIGNLDRCWEVIKEVWDRRDADEAQKLRQRHRNSLASPGLERSENPVCMDYEATVSPRRRYGSFPSSVMPPRLVRSSTDLIESIDYERTVRGRLHWVGVMKHWKWEVLLG